MSSERLPERGMRSEEPERSSSTGPDGMGSSDAPAPLIVVSGPSGAGKTTVVDRLLARTSLPLRRAITATTRDRRLGEEDGKSYYFWNVEQFQSAIAERRMLEWEIVHGKDYYGTPRDEVDRFRAVGTGVILVIDVKGACSIRTLYTQNRLSVFIDAPPEELESRLRARGAETEEKIQRRLISAKQEIARRDEFDHIIVNCELDRAVAELEGLIARQFQRS